MKRINMLILCLMTSLFCQQNVYAYSMALHRRITEKVIDQNTASLNNYLGNVGLTNGLIEPINNKRVREWIEDGSYYEDYNWTALLDPLYSHFYNPITNTSGVGSVFPSAYDWANDPNNPWSWQKARDNLYNGLTRAAKTDREKALGDSFKAIGHVMHLMEDMSVPAHTRGDLHAMFPFNVLLGVGKDNYESYTDGLQGSLNYTLMPFPYWNESTASGAPRQLWDLDSYDVFGNDRIGLAEYTNANFFSDGTIFDDFTFPAWASVVEYEDIEATTGKVRTYLKKTADGELIDHLAAGRWYYKYLSSDLKRLGLTLDGNVCSDYANKLLPRAVGYSAGLLSYFFRGQIDMIPDEEAGSGYVIANNTNENMEGTFELYYDKDEAGNNERAKVDLSNSQLSIAGNGKSQNIYFSTPTGAKEPGKYILIFRGNLGNEEGAVVGNMVEACNSWLDITDIVWWSPETTTTPFPVYGDPIYDPANGIWTSNGGYYFSLLSNDGGPTGWWAPDCWWTGLRFTKVRIAFEYAGEYMIELLETNQDLFESLTGWNEITSGQEREIEWLYGYSPDSHPYNDLGGAYFYGEGGFRLLKMEVYVPCSQRLPILKQWMKEHPPLCPLHRN